MFFSIMLFVAVVIGLAICMNYERGPSWGIAANLSFWIVASMFVSLFEPGPWISTTISIFVIVVIMNMSASASLFIYRYFKAKYRSTQDPS